MTITTMRRTGFNWIQHVALVFLLPVQEDHMQAGINQKHLEHLKQYVAQVGAGILTIHLACNGCLETGSLGVLRRVIIIYTEAQGERREAQPEEREAGGCRLLCQPITWV